MDNRAKSSLKKRSQSLEAFDRLPRELKQLTWYAPVKIAVSKDSNEASCQAWLKSIGPFLAFEAYGPDHPEAQAYVRTQPTAEGLGL